MKRIALAVAQVLVLVGTLHLLIATSRPPCTDNTPETQMFEVKGTCGPPGVITIRSSAQCQLIVDDAGTVFLPGSGEQAAAGPVESVNITLGGWMLLADGGTLPLQDGGVRAPAGTDQTGSCVGSGCPAGNYRSCAGGPDGGVTSLTCTTDGETCTAELTPIP